MNSWRDLFKSLQAELDRLSQEVDGRRVLPNSIDLALPEAEFARWGSVLEAVTAELGEALVAWAKHGRRTWYARTGPFLSVHLERCSQPELVCDFRKDSPVQESQPDTSNDRRRGDSDRS